MKNSLGFRVSGLRLRGIGALLCVLLQSALLVCGCFGDNAKAQDVRAKAEAEGKVMMYATFTAADSKTLVDAFKQAYPKIDAAYYRTTDSALMERYLSDL
jgi:hypothetical protein